MAAIEGLSAVVPEIRIFSTEALASEATAVLAELIAEATHARGRCRFGLAGGGTPRPVYERLAAPTLAESIDWNAIDWYWGDERAVPPDDQASNYAMVHRCLLASVGAPVENVHRICGELDPEAAALAYEEVLGDKPLDVLLLGMGSDGHTASLFPGSVALEGVTERVIATSSPVPPVNRISLSLRAINEARVVVLLVAGAGKATRLAEVRRQQLSGTPLLPAARVQPAQGRLIWLLDTAAAERLEDSK